MIDDNYNTFTYVCLFSILCMRLRVNFTIIEYIWDDYFQFNMAQYESDREREFNRKTKGHVSRLLCSAIPTHDNCLWSLVINSYHMQNVQIYVLISYTQLQYSLVVTIQSIQIYRCPNIALSMYTFRWQPLKVALKKYTYTNLQQLNRHTNMENRGGGGGEERLMFKQKMCNYFSLCVILLPLHDPH